MTSLDSLAISPPTPPSIIPDPEVAQTIILVTYLDPVFSGNSDCHQDRFRIVPATIGACLAHLMDRHGVNLIGVVEELAPTLCVHPDGKVWSSAAQHYTIHSGPVYEVSTTSGWNNHNLANFHHRHGLPISTDLADSIYDPKVDGAGWHR